MKHNYSNIQSVLPLTWTPVLIAKNDAQYLICVCVCVSVCVYYEPRTGMSRHTPLESSRRQSEMTVKRTRLCYWIARPAKPLEQSSNTSRVRYTVISHTSVRSRFYHIHILYKGNWAGFWLINSTQKSYSKLHIFKIRNLFYCVAESWWNMPFKRTRHGNGVAYVAVAKLLRLWHTR